MSIRTQISAAKSSSRSVPSVFMGASLDLENSKLTPPSELEYIIEAYALVEASQKRSNWQLELPVNLGMVTMEKNLVYF